MQIRFTPTEHDWRSALESAPRSGWGSFPDVQCHCFCSVETYARGIRSSPCSCVIASVVVAVAGYEVPRWQQRGLFRTRPSSGGERSVVVDEKGIEMVFPHGHSQLDWCGFTQYRETRNSFLFLTAPERLALWIPKRVMSAIQVEELRGTLQKNPLNL